MTRNRIVIDEEEIQQVTTQLEGIMREIVESGVSAFDVIKRTSFYEEGVAKETIDRVFLSEYRVGAEESELLIQAPDMLGKIQSLAMYYNIINEYCADALVKFREGDAQVAKFLEQKQWRLPDAEQ